MQGQRIELPELCSLFKKCIGKDIYYVYISKLCIPHVHFFYIERNIPAFYYYNKNMELNLVLKGQHLFCINVSVILFSH